MRGRNLGLVFSALLYLASWPLAQQFSLDWKLDRMFPTGEPLMASYHRLENRFGGNEIVLAVYRDPELWDANGRGLDRMTMVSRRLAKVPGVRGVLSLAELHRILETLHAPFAILQPNASGPMLLDKDNRYAQSFAQVFEGYTHLADGDTVAIACMLEPLDGSRLNHRLSIAEVQNVLAAVPAPAHDSFVTGEPVMVTEGFDMIERDGWRLGVVSTGLLGIVLLVVFRSLRWSMIPLVIVHWSTTVTQAILVLLKLELTMVSSMLTAIITVVGVATSIHLLLAYQRHRATGMESAAAMSQTMHALRPAVCWACLTDAVGFVSLTAAEVGPVRDFGIMMAIGSLVVLAAILLLVPGLALIGSWDRDLRVPPFDALLRMTLRRLFFSVLRHRYKYMLFLTTMAVLGVWGSLRIQIETDFTKNFRRSSPLVQGYSVVENELGGAGVWDIMLPTPMAITEEFMSSVRTLENRLREIRTPAIEYSPQGKGGLRLTKVLSIADADAALCSHELIAKIPLIARLEGMRHTMPVFTRALFAPVDTVTGTRWMRVMLRSREQAPAAQKDQLVRLVIEEVDRFTQSENWYRHFQTAPPRPEVTGYYVLLGRLVESILRDQWNCFLWATGGILFVMTMATRSLWLALAAIVPNALPIFLVLGSMGWLGISVNMGAAMIAAVSMGLSIDSSIHYLLHVRMMAGDDSHQQIVAMCSAQENVGLALVLATTALMAGFLSLCFSQFVPTIVFGVLVTLTMLGGLIGNLIVLPLLIAPSHKGKIEAS